MGCFTKRPENEFNFISWQRGNNVLVSDLTQEVGFCPAFISAPSLLALSNVTNSSIKVDWQDNSSNENGFSVERSLTTGIGFAEINTVSADILTYTDNTVDPSTEYFYRVKATGYIADSNYSNEDNATTSA